jgi:hypothetical protein
MAKFKSTNAHTHHVFSSSPNSKDAHPPFHVSTERYNASKHAFGVRRGNTVVILQRYLDYTALNDNMRDEW